ncbi:MAG: hypothetical protein DRJ35_06575 [Thermoprotei archaeon]|nr:MAG: hypothetical protein DRJ35_06575 [Thermoprotei archaeon]
MIRSTIKISLCGNGGVGKTSIARAYATSDFFPNERITLGIQHFFKKVEFNSNQYYLAIWDLGGEKRFRFLAPAFLKGAKGIIYVFDITREETFLDLTKWIEIARQIVGNVPSVLVGNKLDLEQYRVVKREVAEEFAREQGMLAYVETSAKMKLNVEKPFQILLERILGRDAYL